MAGHAEQALIIRGQVDTTGQFPRASDDCLGYPLRQTMCRLGSIDFCDPVPNRPAAGNGERHQELGRRGGGRDWNAAVRPVGIPATSAFDCTASFCGKPLMSISSTWDLETAGLRRLRVTHPPHISLRNSVIEGSTWGFLAVGKRDTPQTAHSFEVTGNLWKQSPSSYRQSSQSCDIRNDWDCPASVYDDIPWGISHHPFWSPMNGALFRSRDILGNVKFANNYVYDAYNGIRSTISVSRRKTPSAGTRPISDLRSPVTSQDIRDNPIEPEGHAAFWIIKQNTFMNVHAAVQQTGLLVMTCWSSATSLRRSVSRARAAVTKDG